MPNLRDNIKAEIENKHLTDTFSPSDIVSIRPQGDYCYVNGEKYKKKSINEILANHSIGPGDRKGESVKRGGEILFVKLGNAQYSLFDEDGLDIDDSKEDEIKQGSTFTDKRESDTSDEDQQRNSIALQFVEYLRYKPYRIKKSSNSGTPWTPSNGSVHGWSNRLQEYRWGGKNWTETSAILRGFTSDINNLVKPLKEESSDEEHSRLEHDAKRIYDQIKAWGNPKGAERDGSFILNCICDLSNGKIKHVDSTLTKLYALGDPNNYVIYDSRVATAILSIAEDIYRYRTIERKRIETVDKMFHYYYMNIGIYPGSGGTRPRGFRWSGWPTAYQNVNAQLDANDLCRRIVFQLNKLREDGRQNWTMREVEAVLFMEGY